MRELSLNVLDIAQNSISAGAKLIEIDIREDTAKRLLTIRIADDGCGMTREKLKSVIDPILHHSHDPVKSAWACRCSVWRPR